MYYVAARAYSLEQRNAGFAMHLARSIIKFLLPLVDNKRFINAHFAHLSPQPVNVYQFNC